MGLSGMFSDYLRLTESQDGHLSTGVELDYLFYDHPEPANRWARVERERE